MLRVIWDTRGYFFWLLLVSALCAGLERIRPWRADQRMLRRQFGQYLFWRFSNGHFEGILVASVAAFVFVGVLPVIEMFRSVRLIETSPCWVQFLVFSIPGHYRCGE